MNKMKIFENKEFGEIRTIMTNGEPWFVGKDVASILGYANTRKALIDHIDEEDKDDVTIRDAIGRNQTMTAINESGLYSLILSSKMPNAKKFKRWVTAEILPTIHKTGGYVNNDELFVNTYLPFADQQTKSMFWQTLHTIRTQNGIIAKQKEELEYKQEVINGFCDVDIYTKRTVICRICKKNANNNFATRWGGNYIIVLEKYIILICQLEKIVITLVNLKKTNVVQLLIMQKNLVILIIYINVAFLYMNLKQMMFYNKY